MLVPVLEEILLVRIVKHTGDSHTVLNRRCPIVFLYIGLKLTYDRENFHVEMYIFNPGTFCSMWKRRKIGNI